MWAQLAAALLGVWLMAAPAVLGYGGIAATNDRIVGPLVVSFGVVAASEVTRPLRWVLLPLGLWAAAAPWLLGYADVAPTLNGVATGLAIAALAFVPGTISQRYGRGWSAVWRGYRRS